MKPILFGLLLASTLALDCLDMDGSLGSTITTTPISGYSYAFQTTIYDAAYVQCSYLSYNGFVLSYNENLGENSVTVIQYEGDRVDTGETSWACAYFTGSGFSEVLPEVVPNQAYNTVRSVDSLESEICAY